MLSVVLALLAGACASRETVTFEPDTQTVLRNPLNGWVVYLGRHWDETFWEKTGYDHIATSEGDTVKVSDYANTAYVRTSWRSAPPRTRRRTARDSCSTRRS